MRITITSAETANAKFLTLNLTLRLVLNTVNAFNIIY